MMMDVAGLAKKAIQTQYPWFNQDVNITNQFHRFDEPGAKNPALTYKIYQGDYGVFLGIWDWRDTGPEPKHIIPLGNGNLECDTPPIIVNAHRSLAQQQIQEDIINQQHEAIQRVRKKWAEASPDQALEHPYCIKKKITTTAGIRRYQDQLLIPMMNIEGLIQSVQIIDPHGGKKFAFQAPVSGLFYMFGNLVSDTILICEGFATGASLYQSLNYHIVVTFSCHNMKVVAPHIKQHYPEHRILVAADNDQWTKNNPGITAAQEIYKQHRIDFVAPQFRHLNGSRPTDFNDLYLQCGPQEVKTQVQVKLPPRLPELDWNMICVGTAPERQWLIENVLPLGIVGMLAAPGDTGKGMLTLDLSLKITGHPDPLGYSTFLGHPIMSHGNVAIFSAEDDTAELHRRLNLLIDEETRMTNPYRGYLKAYPDCGGIKPWFVKGPQGTQGTDELELVKKELKMIKDLKLIVVDPLSSFASDEIDKDPSAGAYIMGQLASLAVENAATVLIIHHTKKGESKTARDMVRGTTALVNGVRLVYIILPSTKRSHAHFLRENCKMSEEEIKEIIEPLNENDLFDGQIAKANGPADRSVIPLVRDVKGLLKLINQPFQRRTDPHFVMPSTQHEGRPKSPPIVHDSIPCNHKGALGQVNLSQYIYDIIEQTAQEKRPIAIVGQWSLTRRKARLFEMNPLPADKIIMTTLAKLHKAKLIKEASGGSKYGVFYVPESTILIDGEIPVDIDKLTSEK